MHDFPNKMSEVNVAYENLKSEIINKIGHSFDLQKVKDYFKYIISSRRKINRVKNLSDIFHLLEERDALDCNNVSTLKHLGTLLKNPDIENLVRGHEKLHAEPQICVCGKSCIFTLPIINPETENSELSEPNDLQIAINNVALNIGKNWRTLASELLVPECYVDEVRDKYPDDFEKQALKILEVWIKYSGEEATVDALKCTLESRLCKKKGLGLHMLKPLITVE